MSRWQSFSLYPQRIVMWGAGDQARVNKVILDSLGIAVDLLIDDTAGKKSPFEGVKIITGDEFSDVTDMQRHGFIVAIGNPYGHIRIQLHHRLTSQGLRPFQLVDPTALICFSAKIGEGIQVMPRAIIHSHAVIKDQCIINTNALIEHDCILESGVEIGPGATLCGRVFVGENTWIGAGAVVRPRVKIGKNVIIGAGSVVVADIPDDVVAFGCPAKPSRLPAPPSAKLQK